MASYDNVNQWMREQLRRIDEMNERNKQNPGLYNEAPNSDGSYTLSKIYKKKDTADKDMTLSPEWESETGPFKSIEQEDNEALAQYKAGFLCMFCKGNLTDRHSSGKDKFIFEFTLGKNRDGMMPESMKKTFCHEWCFLEQIGKSMYSRSFIPNTSPFDWDCHACGRSIDYSSIGTEISTIRKCEIVDPTQGKFQVQGHLHFCISCWVDMAGESFFI